MTESRGNGRDVFAVIGDRYHNADYIKVHLDRLFSELELSYDFTIDYDEITPERLSRHRLFLFFRDGLIFPDGYVGPDAYPYATALMNDPPRSETRTWVTEPMVEAVAGFVEQGGGLYSMHNNPSVATHSRRYRELIGGEYLGHPAVRPFKVEVVDRDHPITQGVTDWITTDEQHYPSFEKDPSLILLRSRNIDELVFEDRGVDNAAGWAFEHGRGRIVHSAPGHNLYSLWQPSYLTFQKNAIHWLLREL